MTTPQPHAHTAGSNATSPGVEAFEYLVHLAAELGPRPIGSRSAERAATLIARSFEAAGLAVERQAFPCVAWQASEVACAVGTSSLPATANPFSPACALSGPMLALSTLDELQAAQLTGVVAVLYGELTQEVVGRLNNPVYLSPAHRTLAETLIAKQPAAVITISPTLGGPLPVLEDWALPFPSVTLAPEHGLALLKEASAPVQLRIVAERRVAEGWNIIGRSVRPTRLVLAAHYDTKHGTPGAIDNASGVAVLLTLARRLGARGMPGLEFVAFSGEEYGLGGEPYLAAHGLESIPFGQTAAAATPSALDELVAMINIDGVGQALGTTLVGAVAGSPALNELLEQLVVARAGVVVRDPGPASNHYDFFSHGVPSVVFSSIGLGNLIHLPHDTPHWASADKLGEVSAMVEALVEKLLPLPIAATRPGTSRD